ncbi:TadE/TadG family type IV pilus assembly protein [Tsuneonella rigui]|uniref:TadE/TadG family type IV pilus assembly protein n=1 Tax=Tsuneonella rigui TaxID=1708790 RepID=UPI0019D0AEBF|nr:TadE/TadG family type IV pilus assembly protein [Tsuneonella rigui]
MRGRSLLKDRTGSAAIEFGLIAPVFLTMLLGVFQVGVWMQSYNAMRNAITETARSVAVEYQTDNKLTDVQIENTGLAVATTSPYLLDRDSIDIAVDSPTAQSFPGARELTLTMTYQLPTFLDFAGISGPEISYSRSLFVVNE